ncbi:MAG TPA: exodeoxyribonuclease VII large subunit [Chitinophagales bacterium]|nr:exodeoxyribonuclease VII large subunit [Chitinophagales bacterium]
MPLEIANKKVFSLAEVTASIERTIEARYKSAFWMTAEMKKLNFYKHSGHCYPDLIVRSNEKVIAQVRATLWKGDYQNINRKFLNQKFHNVSVPVKMRRNILPYMQHRYWIILHNNFFLIDASVMYFF